DRLYSVTSRRSERRSTSAACSLCELSDHHTISLPVSHYALVTVICHVTTFHNYEDTALKLQNQVSVLAGSQKLQKAT
ncbi:hypothetical protein A6R68_11170, partial [Neotoma lepida]